MAGLVYFVLLFVAGAVDHGELHQLPLGRFLGDSWCPVLASIIGVGLGLCSSGVVVALAAAVVLVGSSWLLFCSFLLVVFFRLFIRVCGPVAKGLGHGVIFALACSGFPRWLSLDDR